ncbi:hypothetical protein HETIRDRAFT_322372 [Heterobasidion irregulare TC 32-1]|uniref:Uncharacterized protein n=1 Tax=Heterobasidion irregulare (strain TC 32-1) TaxID=747525 RepID=W4K2K8_HETIT|nr:uncharacterized protein HETIRDRAFT_322372 [Heterobasidion irregulare TC 32-1]ETW80063.1 hypothetical protein HETIRDRAFT_322372 [Heterobasidion irregulare TC 32-1]
MPCCLVQTHTVCTSPWPHSYSSPVFIPRYFIDPTTVPVSSYISEVPIVSANYSIRDRRALPNCSRSLRINKGLKFVDFQTTYFQAVKRKQSSHRSGSL